MDGRRLGGGVVSARPHDARAETKRQRAIRMAEHQAPASRGMSGVARILTTRELTEFAAEAMAEVAEVTS
jgi:hypothetical protein